MTRIDDLVAEIELLSEHYVPSAHTKQAIAEKTIVPIVSPFGVGKTSLMRKMQLIDSQFSYVQGFTTRPARDPLEDAYRFRQHDVATLKLIRDELKQGALVQAAVHPTNRYIYASDLESYVAPYNVLDVLTTALAPLQQLGFKQIVPIYLVCRVDDWKHRLAASQQIDVMTAAQLKQRWAEAKLSLEYAIGHHEEFIWLENPANKLTTSASQAIELVRTLAIRDYQKQQQCAREMLNFVITQL